MNENLEKENKELKEKLDFLTQEMKEIKETLKLVSSKEREVKKTLDNNNLNRSPEETAKFIESALKADPVDCNNNNLLHKITKNYLIELIADMRVGQVVFQKFPKNNILTWDSFIKDHIKVDLNKKSSFYRTISFHGTTIRNTNPVFKKLFDYINNVYFNKKYNFDTIYLINSYAKGFFRYNDKSRISKQLIEANTLFMGLCNYSEYNDTTLGSRIMNSIAMEFRENPDQSELVFRDYKLCVKSCGNSSMDINFGEKIHLARFRHTYKMEASSISGMYRLCF